MTTTEALRRWKKLARVRGTLLTERARLPPAEKAAPRASVAELMILQFQFRTALQRHAHATARAVAEFAKIEQKLSTLIRLHKG